MALPKELNFLKTVEKYKVEGTKDISIGDDIFTLRALSVDETLECVKRSWEEVPNIGEQPAVFASALKTTVLTYCITRVNGSECPSPNTIVYDDDSGEAVGSFFDILRDIIKGWDDAIFSYVLNEYEEFKDKHTKSIEKKYGIKVNNADLSKILDFQEDIENMESYDKSLADSVNTPVSENAFDPEPVPEYSNLENRTYQEEPEEVDKVVIPENQGAVVAKPPRI